MKKLTLFIIALTIACIVSGTAYAEDPVRVGEEFQVNTYTDDDQSNPSVAELSGGGFVVTWSSYGQDGSEMGIYGQIFDSAGSKVGNEFQVNTYTTNWQYNPSTAALSSGGFVVTWDSDGQDGSFFGVFGQLLDSAGNKVGNEFQVNTYTNDYQGGSSVAGLSGGGFVVTWDSYGQDGSELGVYGQLFDSAGSKVGDEFQINTYTNNGQGGSSAVGLTDGGFVVTWVSEFQDGSYKGIYSQLYNSAGNKVGDEFRVNTYTWNHQYNQSSTGLSGGGFVVTWQSEFQDGSFFGVFGQILDSAGNKVGNEFQVNTTTYWDQVYPIVAGLSGGGFVVTWLSGCGIYGQLFDSAGNKVEDEFLVKCASGPAVEGVSSSGFVVTWQSDGQDGSGLGVYGQLFATENGTVNQPPVIDSFIPDPNPAEGEAPLDVTFTCTAHDPDGSIQTYTLDYGNTTVPETNFTGIFDYTYYDAGAFQAICTAEDYEDTTTTSQPITVSVSALTPDISITSQPLEFFNDAAPYMPNVLKIKARVLNKGNGTAEHVVVNFTLDGAPIVGGSVDLGSIESLQNKDAEIEWTASSNVESATVEATVELVGQEDGDPSDNAISQLISFYFVPFRHDVDAFCFENWGLQTWDDYLDEFSNFLVAQAEEGDISTFITASIGGSLFTLLGKEGHCYGMAVASSSYYLWPRVKPVNENTFSMTPAEAKPDIIERHWKQLLHIWKPLISMWKENIPYDAGEQYDEIVDYVKYLSMPVPLALRNKTEGGGHSVVAYKILELGDDDKRVFVYENNIPYDDPLDAYSPPPGHRKNEDYYITFKPISNSARYWNNKYDRVFAIEPWEIIGSEEIIASVKEALSSVFGSLWNKGLRLLRLRSPVTCLLTDQFGRRIGYVDSNFINEIPNAEMEEQLGSQLFYLPADLTYTVEMTGTAMGKLGIDIVTPTNEYSARIVIFENIPVNLGTEAMTTLDTTDMPCEVVLDTGEVVEPINVGGIGSSDIVQPTSVSTLVSTIELYYAMGWLKNADIRNGLLDKLYAVQKALSQSKTKPAKRILQAFILQAQSDANVDDRAKEYLSAYAQYMIGRL